MQQMSSMENSNPQEINSLGERYHLGAVVGAYYVSYTQADVHRYRIAITFFAIAILFIIFSVMMAILLAFNQRIYLGGTTPFFTPFWVLPLLFSLYLRRKWGNRPFITPEHRQQRVYLYQGGLVKKTPKHCEVVPWSQMYDVVYTPPMRGDQPDTFNAKRAGIQLSRYGGRVITLSGALFNLEDLAWRMRQACDQNRHIAVHMDKQAQSPL